MFDVSISSHIRNTLTLSFLAMFFLTVLGRGLRGYLASCMKCWNFPRYFVFQIFNGGVQSQSVSLPVLLQSAPGF